MVVPSERLLCSVSLQERGLFGDPLCVVWGAGMAHGCVLLCSLEKLKSALNLIKNKFNLLLTITEFSY